MPIPRVKSCFTLLGILTLSTFAATASEQDTVGSTPPETQTPTFQDLAKEKQNPFSETINLPFQFATGFGVGPNRNTADQLTIQPLIPIALNADWLLIARPSLSVAYTPGQPNSFGLGDLQASFFLTPTRTDRWTWGVGPAFQLPTATSNELGTGKWSAGPTGALVYSEGPWFAGVLMTQLWSFAGPNRATVNQTSVELDASYNYESGWYIQFDPTITYNGAAASRDAWTVPLGLDVGKVTKIGAQAVSFQLGAYDFVTRPTDAAQWMIRVQIAFLFPQ